MIKGARILVFIISLFISLSNHAGNDSFPVRFECEDGAFPLVVSGKAVPIITDCIDDKGILRAAGDLQADIEKVTGIRPVLLRDAWDAAEAVIVGTVGKSKIIDRLVREGRLRKPDLQGKWESFVTATLDAPVKGIDRAVVIAGSDKRGTIYGMYELSQKIGVSPWYWWADVAVPRHEEIYISRHYYASGEPKVKYRGIFLNDEFPCMTAWAREKFGGMNSKMYAHLFELLLRLRANTLWPAMWGSFKEYKPLVPVLREEDGRWAGNCFNEDDPENPRLADEYGIVMGTSHHEPMQRSQQEWIRHKQEYGNAEWNWKTNKEALYRFFTEGIEHTKSYESLVTIGMRGDEDREMADAGSEEANFRILEDIIKEQRRIIAKATGRPAEKTPQVWTLYKEVQEYYEKGLKVPDDVIIMLCDDDWGHVRTLPSPEGKRHKGGYGMYYHVNYYGAPRAGKWLTMSGISEMWEQMSLAYEYGVDRLWMLNVGDLKPNEFVTDFFLRMAWEPERFHAGNLKEYAEEFCRRQFGDAIAGEAAALLMAYGRYASRVVAEHMDEQTYNLETGEFKAVRDELMALEARALRLFVSLSASAVDSYRQLLLYPIQGMANLYDMYYSLAMNRRLYDLQLPEANEWADRVEACFMRDSLLCAEYNHVMSGGKWNHMADQVHIGYTSWHAPRENIRPRTMRMALPEKADSLQDGFAFQGRNGVVVMEAEHCFSFRQASSDTRWTVVPWLGRSRSGVTVMPRTEKVAGSELTYRMRMDASVDSITVHLVFATLMPFVAGGHYVSVAWDGKSAGEIGINQELVWENKYTQMYPAAAARVIEKTVTLPCQPTADGWHELVFRPLSPGIVLEKVIVDYGGYETTRLFMPESRYERVLHN